MCSGEVVCPVEKDKKLSKRTIWKNNRLERLRFEIGGDQSKEVCTSCLKIKDKTLFWNDKGKLCKQCLECRTESKTRISQTNSKKKQTREEGNPICRGCSTEDATEFDWNERTGRWMTYCRRCSQKNRRRDETRRSQNREDRRNGRPVCECCGERDESQFVFNETKNIWSIRCKSCAAKGALRYKESTSDPTNVAQKIKREAKHDFHLTDAQLLLLVLMNTCEYCGFHQEGVFLGIDRVDSRKGYTVENCLPCCWRCNTAKGSRDPVTFIGQALYCAMGADGGRKICNFIREFIQTKTCSSI